jgi:hypothetical protein
LDMPSTLYLILSEVEGRTTSMQCSETKPKRHLPSKPRIARRAAV